MKKLFYYVLGFGLLSSAFFSCKDDTEDQVKPDPEPTTDTTKTTPTPVVKQTYPFSLKLTSDVKTLEGFTVTISKDTALTLTTDAEGKVSATLNAGKYDVSATGQLTENGKLYTFNGKLSDVEISEGFDQTKVFEIALEKTTKSQIVIKELYNGGCTKNDGKGTFQNDKYVIVYNNSGEKAELKNFGLAMIAPANSFSTNKNLEGGKLVYADQGFIPAIYGIWYMPEISFEAYEQKVIVINGAIDNTATVTNSVNLANSAYYACYDVDDFKGIIKPSDEIPATQYFSAVKCGALTMTAWPLSVSSPALLCFSLDEDPETYGNNESNLYYESGTATRHATDECIKIPTANVIDGIEVFSSDEKYANKNNKRLTDEIDKGYVVLTNYQGHTLYRNVDKEATEALKENAEKLVTAADGSIDAEASIKNGAHIIYIDTNDSSTDFYEREKSSLKD
ncbi:MAG: DUF4876 domain-containing protein [Bacteroidales bacterium]|nr:DUF4876 domain-containing protein [Bacteroidales bacterium]